MQSRPHARLTQRGLVALALSALTNEGVTSG